MKDNMTQVVGYLSAVLVLAQLGSIGVCLKVLIGLSFPGRIGVLAARKRVLAILGPSASQLLKPLTH